MAKLTALSNLSKNTIANSGASELSVMVEVDKINFDNDFQSLFPLDEKVIENIVASIKEKNGFDKSQPIHLLRDNNILIDGHNRLEAAKRAGLKEVPVFYHDFSERKNAIEYAILLQTNRRNLNDAELFEVINYLDKLKTPGIQPANVERGKSAEILSKKIGVSRSKIEKIRTIKNKGDEKTIDAVTSGEMSINAGYNAVQNKSTEIETQNVKSSSEVLTRYSCELEITNIQFQKLEKFLKRENIKYYILKE